VQIGPICGYAPGSLTSLIVGPWAGEMKVGVHYYVLRGKTLKNLKDQLSTEDSHFLPWLKKTSTILLLNEKGLYALFLRTTRPAGVRLRSYLSAQVLPQLCNNGTYLVSEEEMNDLRLDTLLKNNGDFSKLGEVYFIINKEANRVKIGFSACVSRRLCSLQASSAQPLQLLCSVAGTREDERQLHVLFDKYHSHYEWFHLTPEILRFAALCRMSEKYTLSYLVEQFTFGNSTSKLSL
jgi:hypothetical protein